MPPKVKIEENLPDGNKITVVLEGPNVSSEQVIQFLDFIKYLSRRYKPTRPKPEGKLGDIIWEVIFNRFGEGTLFSSRDLFEALREEGIDVDHRAVATYLLRFYRRGMLDRFRDGPRMKYKIKLPVA